MATADDNKDLWQEALGQLSVEDRDEIESTDKLESLKILSSAARSKKDECIDKGWSIYRKKDGTYVKLRHILEKIAGTADQIIAVGTLAVGFDTSGHAAAPWAVVKMLISGATSNINVFTELGEGIETVTDALERFAIVEKLYLNEEAATRQPIDGKITKLYASILAYLAAAKRYFAASTPKKIAKGIKDSVLKQHAEMQRSISAAEEDLDKWVQVANANVLHDVRRGLGDVSQIMALQLAIAEDNLNKYQRQKILQWLSTISYTSQHSLASRNLLENSGLWLLNHKQFVDWEDSPDSSVFWLHGSSGTGKTSLVSQVIDYLAAPRAGSHKCPVAYFYCSRTAKPQPADPDMIMSCILKQLASSPSTDEPIRLPVVAEYDKRAGDLDADAEPAPLYVTESVELSLELCHNNPAYIVIDALDECDERRRHELINAVDQIVSRSQKTVKVFLSSRSDTDVSSHIRRSPLTSITVISEMNQEDINRFIESEVDRLHEDGLLLRGLWSKRLRNKTIERLKLGSQGMFRWVVLSLESLRLCKTVPDYKERLQGLPEELAKLYDILFADIRKSGEGALKTAELVMSFLKVEDFQPTIAEVVDAALGLSDDDDSDDDSDDGSNEGSDDNDDDNDDNDDDGSDEGSDEGSEDGSDSGGDDELNSKALHVHAQLVVNICRNLVIVDAKHDTFRFAHPSVNDYIMTLESFRADKRHARMLCRCLAELMRNRWLKIPNVKLYQSTSLRYRSQYCVFLRYSVSQWMEHCGAVAGTHSETDKELSVALGKFLFPETSKPRAHLKLRRAISTVYMLQGLTSSKQAEKNKLEGLQTTALHIVAATGFVSILDKVLPDKSKIDVLDAYGYTALCIATMYDRVEMVKELLGRGADPGAGDTSTSPSWHNAVWNGNVQIAKMLFATGKCDVNISSRGETPWMMAMWQNEDEMARFLLSQPGIDLTDPGLLPIAIRAGFVDIVQELLRRSSVHPNAPFKRIAGYDRTTLPLLLAIEFRNKGTVKALLDDERVDPAARDEDGQIAHTRTLYKADREVLDIFFNHPRVDPNSVDELGNTALHHTVEKQYHSTAKFLLAHPKVRVDVYNKAGRTPLDIAISKGDDSIADLIRQHPGAKLIKDERDGGGTAPSHELE